MPWYLQPTLAPDALIRTQAEERQSQLTKPPGSLGRLETIAIELAAMQGHLLPQLNKPAISVFAADHGIADEGVSAFPQVVTTEMVRNFARGGAAISVLAKLHGAVFEVIDLGTVIDPGELAGVVSARIAPGTANFAKQAAMTGDEFERAMSSGAAAAERALEGGAELFIGGEMGIANTTAASALAAAMMDIPLVQLVGPGTGIGEEQMSHKLQVIENALVFHQGRLDHPVGCAEALGGFEIVALAGAYIRAAQLRLPVLVDGFITTVAALLAVRLNPGCRDWMLFSHGSAEPGHRKVLAELAAEPLVDLNMRLGEGSGAAVVLPLLQSACALHNQMATFAEAAVTDKE